MGLYFTNTGRTWKDDDLLKPYRMEEKIRFKKDRIPDGIPTLYKLNITPKNIVMHNNFPFEFQIKKGIKVENIKPEEVKKLLKLSGYMMDYMDVLNFNY